MNIYSLHQIPKTDERLCFTRYTPNPADYLHFRIPSPMAAINGTKFLAFAAAASMLSDDAQWKALSGLTLGALIGGLFGMIMLMLTTSSQTNPWQIYAWRFGANLLGGIGIGSLALWGISHFWEMTPGPFMTLGVGFSAGFMCVGVAKKFEKVVLNRLDALSSMQPGRKQARPDPPTVNLAPEKKDPDSGTFRP